VEQVALNRHVSSTASIRSTPACVKAFLAAGLSVLGDTK
jgi:hypothetical protein